MVRERGRVPSWSIGNDKELVCPSWAIFQGQTRPGFSTMDFLGGDCNGGECG